MTWESGNGAHWKADWRSSWVTCSSGNTSRTTPIASPGARPSTRSGAPSPNCSPRTRACVPQLDGFVAGAYPDALDLAVAETPLDYDNFPSVCPWPIELILSGDWPGEASETS